MKAIFLFILVSTLLLLPCSAENVTIEIFETSDIFYISLNDGDLIACPDEECTLDITNYTTNLTTTELEISKDAKKDIAQYVYLELLNSDVLEYTGGVNESFITNSNIELRTEILDGIYARTQTHFVPAIEEINACKTNLTATQNMIVDLKATASSHGVVLEAKEEKIENLEEAKENATLLAAGLAILFVASLLFQGNRAQEALDWWKNRRN